jgi:hypothetical protein
MGRLTVRSFAIVAAIALAGCGYKPAGSTGPRTGSAGTSAGGAGGAAGAGGTGGAAGFAGGGGGGTGGTGGSLPIIYLDGGSETGGSNRDSNCGARSKTAMKVPPDILIVLDRSGSMNECLTPDAGMSTNCGANSKWAKLIPAITQVVTETESDVNWGLKFFPDNTASTCDVNSTANVDIAPGNGAAIMTAIMGSTATNGGVMSGYNNTPTRAATVSATTYLSGLTDTSKRFILLATDGQPTCAAGTGGTFGGGGGDDSAATVTAIGAAKTAGFPTFVVGIATGGGSADTTLSNMANAGGLARSGTPSYYPVTSAADLSSAIHTLIGVAATCTFQIGPNPTDDGTTSLDKIDVVGDGEAIERDMSHTDGYDYIDDTHQSIQVYGPRCEKIMSGEIHEVSVTFRCLVT